MTEEGWANLGRQLADALMQFAHDRSDTAKKLIAQLNTDMCAIRRAELAEPPTPESPQGVD